MRTATTIAVALIVAGILLHVLGANLSNGIASAVNDAARWLVQPFKNVFHLHSAKGTIALNWGIAAVVYAIVGGVIATAIARSAAASRMRRPLRRRAVV
ncbi:MAG TPA: hypothetical protein VFL87_07520 [Thermoleophilaceae bacterium]|nr:hypothetical protein [Thermoleophilaceae bacterium]